MRARLPGAITLTTCWTFASFFRCCDLLMLLKCLILSANCSNSPQAHRQSTDPLFRNAPVSVRSPRTRGPDTERQQLKLVQKPVL